MGVGVAGGPRREAVVNLAADVRCHFLPGTHGQQLDAHRMIVELVVQLRIAGEGAFSRVVGGPFLRYEAVDGSRPVDHIMGGNLVFPEVGLRILYAVGIRRIIHHIAHKMNHNMGDFRALPVPGIGGSFQRSTTVSDGVGTDPEEAEGRPSSREETGFCGGAHPLRSSASSSAGSAERFMESLLWRLFCPQYNTPSAPIQGGGCPKTSPLIPPQPEVASG